MKKSNFVALILGMIRGVFFALGMCMALVAEWGTMQQGIISGAIGLVILLAAIFIWRKMEGKEPVKISGKTIGAVLVGLLGAILLGVGMCFVLVIQNMVLGTVIGLVGIVVLLMLIPLTKGLK